MSTQYNRPGIFINETLTPLVATAGVPGQATAVFAANYFMGPTTPTFVSSWNQYVQRYGSFTQSQGSLLHYAVFQYFNNGGTGCYILSVPNTDATTATLTLQDINVPADNILTVSAMSPGTWGNNLYVATVSAGNTGRFNLQVYQGGTASSNLVETFVDLSVNPIDPRNVLAIVNSPKGGSNYITLTQLFTTYTAGVTDPALIAPTALTGGGNGVTAPNLATSIPTALDTLQGMILNLNVPGLTTVATLNALITWATGRGNVMMVIDGPVPTPPSSSSQVAQNYINMVTGGSPITNSTFATLYAPWIQISDPASTAPGSAIWVPPGGAVLGIWSATDNAKGPWQSPAGISYGQINLMNIEALFTDTDLQNLNTNNINAIRFVPTYYPCVMGARTLQQGYPSRYLSVRRTLIQLETDFTNLIQFALFEPNDQILWDQVVNTLTTYLTGLMQRGVLAGSTQNTSFSVTCDSSNNTPATVGAGILNVSVAVALQNPAEFIVINVSQFQNTGTTTVTTQTP